MVYAFILSSVACVLAVLAFCLVAQPSLWMKLWSPHRGYILVTDTAAAAYNHTGIRVRLAMVGLILAAAAMVIPAGFAAWDASLLSPQTASAAAPPASAWPHPRDLVLPETAAFFSEPDAAFAFRMPAPTEDAAPATEARPVNNLPAPTASTLPALTFREGANNHPATAADNDAPSFLPTPQPAAAYASREEAAQEVDPTLSDTWTRTAVSHAGRGANNDPEIP